MRVLFCGDSPLLSTGFGRVNAIAAQAMQDKGWEVASVAGLQRKEMPDNGIKIYLPDFEHGDPTGVNMFQEAVDDFKPDIVYMTADTGSAVLYSQNMPSSPPLFCYMLIEGGPIVNKYWKVVCSQLDLMVATKYGSDLLKEQFGREVDWAYHGVDHDQFKVTGIRDDVRKVMHWEDKFVIMTVSANVRRKQLPRLIEAVSILKTRYNIDDIVLYMHTVPFQGHWLEGWNLIDIARLYDVEREVFFNPQMGEFNAAVPVTTGNPKRPGLVELYNASDLFVLPSQVEGFGMPIAEAMACGLPVMVTKYAAGWEVASPAGRGIPIRDWEVHKSGTLYANVDPELLAREILRLRRDPRGLARMSEAGLERVKDFQWSHFTDKLIPALEQTVVTHQERDNIEEEGDTTEAPQSADVDIREGTGEGELQDLEHQPPRQGEDTGSQGETHEPVAQEA